MTTKEERIRNERAYSLVCRTITTGYYTKIGIDENLMGVAEMLLNWYDNDEKAITALIKKAICDVMRKVVDRKEQERRIAVMGFCYSNMLNN